VFCGILTIDDNGLEGAFWHSVFLLADGLRIPETVNDRKGK
jgi:hypothetical protein